MGTSSLARALALDPASAELAPADRAMIDYATKLTLSPSQMVAHDVDGLREHGFDDAAILDICQVTAYYNYVNRLADGLGVELEEEWTNDELTLTRAEFESGPRGSAGQ